MASSTRTTSWQTAVIFSLMLLLQACGGGSDPTPAQPAPSAQKGFGPAQLYDPATNPTGRVLVEGDTGVVFLDAAQPEGRVWFDIASAAAYEFAMEEEDLATLARVAVQDAGGRQVLAVDAAQRTASATLHPGRYALHLTASATLPEALPLFINFGGDSEASAQSGTSIQMAKVMPRANEHQLAKVRARQDCIACDLAGANLSGIDLAVKFLRHATLTGADLSKGNLYKTRLFGANLSQANLSSAHALEIELGYAKLVGANLTKANLRDADMEKANLTNANLRGADLRRAKLSGAKLDGAQLTGAIWTDGRICGPGSVGACQCVPRVDDAALCEMAPPVQLFPIPIPIPIPIPRLGT